MESSNCDFNSCHSDDNAGALGIKGDNFNLNNCSFINCSADGDGGAVWIDGTNCRVSNDRNGEGYFENNPYNTYWEFNGKDSQTGEDIGYGNQKYMIPREDVKAGKAILKFSPYDEYTFRELEIELPGQNPVHKEAKDFTGDIVSFAKSIYFFTVFYQD